MMKNKPCTVSAVSLSCNRLCHIKAKDLIDGEYIEEDVRFTQPIHLPTVITKQCTVTGINDDGSVSFEDGEGRMPVIFPRKSAEKARKVCTANKTLCLTLISALDFHIIINITEG